MKNFAINGFGRIGRLAARVWYEKHQETSSLVAINTSGSMDLGGWAHLLKYDTVYGSFKGNITTEEHLGKDQVSDQDPLLGYIILDGSIKIPVLAQRDPEKIPWSEYQADLVVEATGVFRTEELAKKHLTGGAKQVLLSAPGKGGAVKTVLLGVTEVEGGNQVYSNESCTTNCTAPVVDVLHKHFGIEKAFLTTVHSYTDDQNLQDGSHKDLRRARAAAHNMIPTSTGAATATTRVIPDLEGKFDGISIRVPTITGSLIDLTLVSAKPATVEAVNQALQEAEKSPQYQGIIVTTTDPVVSSDVIGKDESSLVDLSLTKVIDGNLIKVYAWYDNEWGFTNRLIETVTKL